MPDDVRQWYVRRHSGRVGGHWRTVVSGDETRARGVFAFIKQEMRQGSVRLFNGDDEIDSATAPRLRTRW